MDLAELTSQQAWQAFAPHLHIADDQLLPSIANLEHLPGRRQTLIEQLKKEGYIQARNINWGVDLAAMAGTVRALSTRNLSPVFAYLYDEFWVPFFKLHSLYTTLLGNYALLPDFWIWNVDPRKDQAGWRPHRDKGRIALFPDGTPKSLTTWIPLSHATPLNGCMYIVPPRFDPTYGSADENQWRFDLPSVRAMPAAPGDFLLWNQAVVHWGSKTSPLATESRVSMAFEFQRLDVSPFNQPLLRPRTVLPFEFRLKLIAKQILQYQHMYHLDAATVAIAQRLIA